MISHEEQITNPGRYYSQPKDIVNDTYLTAEEKIIALKNWRDDINLKSIATEESMGRKFNNNEIDLMSEIDKLLDVIEDSTKH